MADYKTIYREHPEAYDELVRAEDADGNLVAALQAIHPLTPATRVVEAGAGTGRLTRVLLEAGVEHVWATEVEPAMVTLAERLLGHHGDRVRFDVADARKLPADSDSADLSVAGWVFGHFRHWMPEEWKTQIGAALDELTRVTRSQGTVIVIETLGTGSEEPTAPNPALAEYYDWLEGERGFTRRAIRTDYRFESVEEAARVTGFFFGEDFAARVRTESWATVPECTGIWFRRR